MSGTEAGTFCMPSHSPAIPSYCQQQAVPKYYRAFLLARLNALASVVLVGRLQEVPYLGGLFTCVSGVTVTLPHILFNCVLTP